jgi:acetyltransferase-like isoleucine patch superfamily enzyme
MILFKLYSIFRSYELRYLNVVYKKVFLKCGSSTIFFGRLRYYNPEKISIGNKCVFNQNIFLNISNSLFIGDNVTISSNVFITDTSLILDKLPQKEHVSLPIIIEDDVWIGACTTILPGVTISRGSVIGAGSVVTKTTDPNGVYVGVPAKLLKHIGGDYPATLEI